MWTWSAAGFGTSFQIQLNSTKALRVKGNIRGWNLNRTWLVSSRHSSTNSSETPFPTRCVLLRASWETICGFMGLGGKAWKNVHVSKHQCVSRCLENNKLPWLTNCQAQAQQNVTAMGPNNTSVSNTFLNKNKNNYYCIEMQIYSGVKLFLSHKKKLFHPLLLMSWFFIYFLFFC